MVSLNQNLTSENEEDTPISEDMLDEMEEGLIGDEDEEDMYSISRNSGDYDSFDDLDEM